MKMTVKEVRDFLGGVVSGLYFDYSDKPCGVDPLGINNFDMWSGEDMIKVDSIDKVMSTPFFDGKCLEDICESIEF